MADIVQFPGKSRDASNEIRWKLITICRGEFSGFDVCAWTGRPSDPASKSMWLGPFNDLLSASNHALKRAQELGIKEIIDSTAFDVEGDGPGSAA